MPPYRDEVVDRRRWMRRRPGWYARLHHSGFLARKQPPVLRVAHEPLDAFRAYMAVYAREQAYCISARR